MPNGSGHVPSLLLKCRPTELQLRDRMRQPVPDGIEIYLDLADISGNDWLEVVSSRIAAMPKREDFVFIVEGPLRSLDGSFFDVSQRNPAHEETVRRLVAMGKVIGAKAAVLHCISAKSSFDGWTSESKERDLEEAARFLGSYSKECVENGIVPTIENIPPVARMREGKYLYSSIGVDPTDLVRLSEDIKDLRFTLDVSHAQLFVNAATTFPADGPVDLLPLIEYYHTNEMITSIEDCIHVLGKKIANVHVSNARGLLAEGMAYGDGDMNLDSVVEELARMTQFIVTETIEPDADNAVFMREAQRRICSILTKAEGRN